MPRSSRALSDLAPASRDVAPAAAGQGLPPARPRRAWAAWFWLACVLALAVQQAGFWREARLDTDVLAMLPGAVDDPLLDAANARMADAATRSVVVLLSGDDWARTRAGTEAFVATLARDGVLAGTEAGDAGPGAAIDLLRPHRDGLLTHAQRGQLRTQSPETLAELALARLFAPGAGGGFGRWQDDPLGLWPVWWQARAGRGLMERDGLVALHAEERDWAVLRLESTAPAFRLDGQARLRGSLDRAAAAAKAAGGALRIVQGGVPLHAEAAAVRASFEVGTIGLGSLLAVVTLVWLAFRSPRPMLLVALSLLIGTAAGVAATALVFDRVHLLTLVFGASLVGVAEDYGIHYFACRQSQPQVAPRALMRSLLPALALALGTSVLAYGALGIAPFPGLRQMAVFAAAGLAAAFATAVLWFPWLDRGVPAHSRFAAAVAGSLAHWPRWRPTAAGWLAAALVAAVIAGGLLQLRVDDELRGLQASPPELIESERRVGALLDLPSPAQFFLVRGPDAQTLLRREEALTDALAAEVAAGRLGGWRAVSDWVPSQARQASDGALVAAAEQAALTRAAAFTGEPFAAADLQRATPADVLAPEAFMAQPIAAPLRALWLGAVDGGHGSVVMLTGVSRDAVAALSAVAAPLDGVRWVDRSADYSALLRHYRERMSWLLLAGYAAVAVLLFARYGRTAWRALLPTALAALLGVSLLGWFGVPLQLFGVLAQLLLLGMGVDYGIFLLEHRGDGASWLAVCLGAASTLLAFGLLSLSATPALHGFGLSLLFGIGLVWLLSPCLRLEAPTRDLSHAPSSDFR